MMQIENGMLVVPEERFKLWLDEQDDDRVLMDMQSVCNSCPVATFLQEAEHLLIFGVGYSTVEVVLDGNLEAPEIVYLPEWAQKFIDTFDMSDGWTVADAKACANV